MSDNTINRREFLKAAAAVSAAPAFLSIVPRHVLGRGQTPPSDKLNIAGIGVGGMGGNNLNNLEAENIVALCDVDPNYAAKTVANVPGRQVLHRLPPDAGGAEGHRRRRHRHTRPHPRGHHPGGDAARQACLHAETPHPQRLRGQSPGAGGRGVEGHDADGDPGPLGRGNAAHQRMDLGGPDRRGDRGRRLVQPVVLPLGPRLLEHQVGRPPDRHAAASPGDGLGPLDRPGADAAVPSRLSPARLALLVGFRRGHDGGPRRPHARPGLLRARARRADEHRGHGLRAQPRDPSAGEHRDLSVPGPGRTGRRSS